ncbi:hypothetical protein [Polaromonas sp.]|uniref:hypothetical protein n=1 Tax=Polaromonas sp. TaxID=1869339 RepID=UPI003BAAE408
MKDEEMFGPDDEIEGDIITIVGGAFHQPIADLIGRLAARHPKPAESYSAGYFENGYCASIAILLVLAFESYVSRISYLRMRALGESRKSAPISTHEYIKRIAPSFPLLEELQDIYVVRDGLAHGHLWSVDYVLRSKGTDVIGRGLFEGFGDNKMRTRVDLETGKTRFLGINVLPTSIGLKDAAMIFRVIALSLDHLVKVGLIEQPAVRGHVRYDGRTLQFWSLHAVLADLSSRHDHAA